MVYWPFVFPNNIHRAPPWSTLPIASNPTSILTLGVPTLDHTIQAPTATLMDPNDTPKRTKPKPTSTSSSSSSSTTATISAIPTPTGLKISVAFYSDYNCTDMFGTEVRDVYDEWDCYSDVGNALRSPYRSIRVTEIDDQLVGTQAALQVGYSSAPDTDGCTWDASEKIPVGNKSMIGDCFYIGVLNPIDRVPLEYSNDTEESMQLKPGNIYRLDSTRGGGDVAVEDGEGGADEMMAAAASLTLDPMLDPMMQGAGEAAPSTPMEVPTAAATPAPTADPTTEPAAEPTTESTTGTTTTATAMTEPSPAPTAAPAADPGEQTAGGLAPLPTFYTTAY